jgi:hypothetical protein
MTNMKKISWRQLALQALCLLSGGAYLHLGKPFREVFSDMGIPVPLAFTPPFLYVYPAVTVCLFIAFLWCWGSGRLETKLGTFINRITVWALIVGVVVFGRSIIR